ncbi:g11787 [Coccomyxa viridis]|uniref:G11787 protein n=1 Tax=Coccomyxa viridis TaxID=1274662 RepID=A0ABP1G9X3_9CHLO
MAGSCLPQREGTKARPTRGSSEGRAVCTAFRGDAHVEGKLSESLYWRAPSYKAKRSLIEEHVAAAVLRVGRFLVDNERLLVVAASTMIMSLSHTALRPVLPVFAKSFGVGAAAVGTTISVYAIARLMMNLPAGILADRYGRKPLLVWGPLITAFGMIGCGMSRNFTQLLAWRWVTGVGSALQMSGSQLYLADISLSSNRARTLGTNQAASLLGGLVGPALGGLLADMSGLRAPFTLTGCAALMAAIYGAIRLPETMGTQKSEPTGASSGSSKEEVLANSSSAAESAAEEEATPLLEAKALQPGEAPSMEALQKPERKLKETRTFNPRKMRPKRRKERPAWQLLLGSRDFGAIMLLNAMMFMTQNGSRAVLVPLLATQAFGVTTTTLGLLFAAMAVVSFVGVMPASFVADKLGRKWTIVPSCLGLAGALLLMAFTGRQEMFTVAMMMYAAASACIGATPAAYAADVMPHSVSGFGLGIYRCAGDIGLMVGPALLGWIADMTSVHTALQVNAVAMIAVVAYFGLAARETKHIRVRAEQERRAAVAAA